MLNLTSLEVLKAYLDSFVLISRNVIINSTTNVTDNPVTNTGSSDEPSAGVIAGIVVSAVVILVILVLVVIAASIYFYGYSSKHKIRYLSN